MPHIIEITELGAPGLLPFTDTSELRLKNELGIFVAESPKVIRTALDAGYEPVSFLALKKCIDGQAGDIAERCAEVPIYTAPPDLIEKITGFKLTQGIMCAMRRKPLPELSDVLSVAERLVILEGIMNQTNVGAIFRNAAALGFDAVLLTGGCSDPLFRRSVRVSMGSVFCIPWIYTDKKAPECIETVRKSGFAAAAMALKDEYVELDDPRLKAEAKLALVFGTEGEGLTAEAVEACDYTVKIPMSRGIDSLNVAAASAAAFWELRKR